MRIGNLTIAGVVAVGVTAALAGCAAMEPGGTARHHSAPSWSVSASVKLAAPPVPAASLPVSLPAPSSVNYSDPTAVSEAAIITQWTMDTVTDASQYQAEVRSAPFLTPAYLATIKSTPPVTPPGAQWNEWAAHRAYTTVSLAAGGDDAPSDTAIAAYTQWGITVTPHGTDGWTGAPMSVTVFVVLSRQGPGKPWLVSSMQVDPS